MLVAFLVLQGFGKEDNNFSWDDFTYNSPEEKAFWDELPDWSGKILVHSGNLNPLILLPLPDGYRRNVQGEIIESNSSEGFNGYVKQHHGYRTIYQFVDGYAVRSKSWWKDGRKWKELDYKEGKPDGLETWWFDNGQKKSETNYKDGKRDGLFTEWYENGRKRRERTYKDGMLDGRRTWWYENGQISEEGYYKDWSREGLWTRWYENGQKRDEENYKDGLLSYAKVWLPDGKECPESKVIDGNGTLITYSLEGKEISRRNIKAGTILIPPRNPRPIPKRPASSEANSSKPTPPSLPPWLVPAAPK